MGIIVAIVVWALLFGSLMFLLGTLGRQDNLGKTEELQTSIWK
jgi:hypothetical protein